MTLSLRPFVVILAAASLAIGLAGCSSTPDTIPNLVGKSVDKAESTLTADNIPFQTQEDGTTGKRQTVSSQTPKAGTSNTGQIVILHVHE
jgi:beta-lactam-binding protein with PASTA domain